MMQTDKLDIPLTLADGTRIRALVFGSSEKAWLFDDENAEANGEAKFQLVEGCEYEYEFCDADGSPVCFQFCPKPELLSYSKIRPNAGTIRTGLYVGTIELGLQRLSDEAEQVASLRFEVQSVKADYRTDYREMLRGITEFYTELLMQQGAPVKQGFEINPYDTAETIYQKFAFVQSAIESDGFWQSVHKVMANPLRKWATTTERQSTLHIRRMDKSCVRQLATSTARMPITQTSNLRLPSRLTTLPTHLAVKGKTDTVDVMENQFVKYALTSFYQFFQTVGQLKRASDRLRTEAARAASKIENVLSSSLFQCISPLTHLNVNSPALQRKDGYRQIFQTWLLQDLAAKLSWHGGETVFSAGKKNVAVLYEYWVFFKLLQLVSDVFGISPNAKSELVTVDDDEINLDLRQGKLTALRGSSKQANRQLNVCLYYNRTFSKQDSIGVAGSWTCSMRPDYTLSVWFDGDSSVESERRAEKEDTIVHVHFDAKYRLSDIPLTGIADEELLTKEKDENAMHIYKRGDLLKMHAYKDAIRRTAGAYILYPGNVEAKKIKGFHEIIPGLGAFCLSPSSEDTDAKAIKQFLLEVKDHLLNRASERERMAFFQHETLNEPTAYTQQTLKERLPETLDGVRLLPNDTFVLLGYCRSKEQMEWIVARKRYNFRAGFRNGTLHLKKEIVSARYVLLHHGGDTRFFKIEKSGPIVANRAELLNQGYPLSRKKDGTVDEAMELKKAGDTYLVFQLDEPEPEFASFDWAVAARASIMKGPRGAHPDSVRLTKLISACTNPY